MLHCYAEGRQRNAQIKGDLTVHFFVSPLGQVQTSIVAHSEIGEAATAQCIASSIERWRFPQTDDGGIATVSLPLKLLPPVRRRSRESLRPY